MDPEEAERLRGESRDLADTTRRQLYIQIFAGFFLMLTLAGPDEQLVRADAMISWPLIDTDVRLSTFLVYAPVALVALLIYLHLFVGRLIQLRRLGCPAPETFIFEMRNPSARALADLLFYAYVPVILAFFSWKVIFREEAPLLVGFTVLVAFGSALVYYLRARHEGARRRQWVGLGGMAAVVALSAAGAAMLSIHGDDRVQQLRRVDLVRADLGVSGDLTYVNLAGVNLSHANMRFARITGADLRQANLSHADLQFLNTGLSGADDEVPRVTDFMNATLYDASLEGSNLRNSSFDCAILRDADMRQVVLERTSFRGANLAGADLTRAVIGERVVFQEANLEGARLNGAEMASVNFIRSNLSGASLIGARIEDTVFNAANLQGAKLSNGNFRESKFRGALMRDADLSWTVLDGASFSGADLTNATLANASGLDEREFRGAILCNTVLPSGEVRDDGCDRPATTPEPASACRGRAEPAEDVVEGVDRSNADVSGPRAAN